MNDHQQTPNALQQTTEDTAKAQLLILDKHQVERLLVPGDVLSAVRDAFILHSRGEGRIFPLVREPLATGGVFGIKSGDVQSEDLLGFKAAGFWPKNRAKDAEPHQATIMLFDPHTGRPVCLIDGNLVTTMRTGAAGLLGLKTFARAESERACVFGTGVQATIQLEFALKYLPALRTVRYATHDAARDAAFEKRFEDRCELSPVSAADRNDAVSASDIVITATPGGGALFDVGAVQPGTHLNCVGADTKGKRELPPDLLARAKVFVDDLHQAKEIGEMQWAPHTDAMEIGALLAGKAVFHRAHDDITLFDMTGLALQDLTVARMLCTSAEAQNVGTHIDWPW